MVEANFNPRADPSSTHFEPDESIFCIIGNVRYEKLRGMTIEKVAVR